MSKFDIKELLSTNAYPGRGIIIGKTQDGTKAMFAYFIMGRSVNSRNRIFSAEGDDVIIYPFDESKVSDPSLIIYYPVRNYKDSMIVTNGNQTDTVYEFLQQGKSFCAALKTREFEPDAPNYTPRISGILDFAEGDFTYKMNILKCGDGKGGVCNRYTFSYEPVCGIGHFIHTYVCDGNPIPTFYGEPEEISVLDDIDQMTDLLWSNLNADNKISLYVRYVDLATRKYEARLINKNLK